jgi:hypothetical protein
MNTIVSTAYQASQRARANGVRTDYFSVKHYECLSELLDHARQNLENIKEFNRLFKKEKDASRRHHYGEMAIEDKAHRHSILARAEELPLVHEGDVARKKELLALCKRMGNLKVV